MSIAARHLVRRQTFELVLPDQAGAAALQDEVRRIVYDRLLPAMDELLTSLSPSDELVRLERLEVDLGDLSSAGLEDELVTRTTRVLEENLQRRIAGARGSVDGRLEDLQLIDAEQSRLLILGTFLASGTLPWWTPGGNDTDIDEMLLGLLRSAPSALMRMLRERASSGALGAVSARLAKQFSPETRACLRSVLSPSIAPDLEDAIEHWGLLLRRGPAGGPGFVDEPGSSATAEAEAFRMLLAGGHQEAGVAELCRRLVTLLARRGAGGEHAVRDALDASALPAGSQVRDWIERGASSAGRGGSADTKSAQPGCGNALPGDGGSGRRTDSGDGAGESAAPEPSARHSDRTMPRPVRGGSDAIESGARLPDHSGPSAPSGAPAPEQLGERWAGVDQTRREAPGFGLSEIQGGAVPHTTGAEERLGGGASLADALGARIERDTGEQRIHDLDEEGQYIDNAGLVLLWPFLTRFLTAAGLVENKAFRSEADQERAVLLLQHLATGASDWPEQTLLLNKVLCGWPLAEPVARSISLREAEIEESGKLIESVIANWEVLKGTSPDGFRGSFLVREGHLKRADQGWQLKVGRTGYDVLLDKLPWGISLVLLPWMNRPLFVEW